MVKPKMKLQKQLKVGKTNLPLEIQSTKVIYFGAFFDT